MSRRSLRLIAANQVAGHTVSKDFRERIDHRLPAAQAWDKTEHALQTIVCTRLRLRILQHPELELLYAIPNGGNRNTREAARLVAEGVKSGVPDLCLPVPRGPYHGLYLELKKAKGTPNGFQWQWLHKLHLQGHYVAIANCPDVALRLILDYLALPSLSNP